MARFGRVLGLVVALAASLTTATPAVPVVQTRYKDGATQDRAMAELARRFSHAHAGGIYRRDTFVSNATKLDTSWNASTLYTNSVNISSNNAKDAHLSVTITCTTCYILGTVQANFTIAGNNNFSGLLTNFINTVKHDVEDVILPGINVFEGKFATYAQEFLNETVDIGQEIENATLAVYNKIADKLDVIPGVAEILDDAEKLIQKGLNRTKTLLKTEFQKLENETISLKDKIQNVTETGFQELKNDIESNKVINETLSVFTVVKNGLEKALEELWDDFKSAIEDVVDAIESKFHIDKLTLPTLPVDFNIPGLPSIPAVSLQFKLGGFEMYLELDLVLNAGATYTLPLFTSETPIGVGLGNYGDAGVVVKINLVLDIEAQIDISSGFHLKMDRDVLIDLELFSQNVTNFDFPGAQFEFLPVQVAASGAILKGALAIELKAGIDIDNKTINVLDHALTFGAGVEVNVFATVAKFLTNITGPSTSSLSSNSIACELEVIEYFEFNVGAAAGATIAFGTHNWGPNPATTIPLFTTTLADACAAKRTPSTTTATTATVHTARAVGLLPGRQAGSAALTTTTLTSTAVFTGQTCASSGLIHCPASLQVTSTYLTTLTLVTAVAAGVTPTFPATTANTNVKLIAFGTNVKSAAATSGPPSSFAAATATPSAGGSGSTDAGGAAAFVNGSTGGVSNKVILGVSIGLGIPILCGIIAGVVSLCRRNSRGKYAPVRKAPEKEGPRSPPMGTSLIAASPPRVDMDTSYSNYRDDDHVSPDKTKGLPIVTEEHVSDVSEHGTAH